MCVCVCVRVSVCLCTCEHANVHECISLAEADLRVVAGSPAGRRRVPPASLLVVPGLQAGQQHLLLVLRGVGGVEQVLPERARQLVPEVTALRPLPRRICNALVPVL